MVNFVNIPKELKTNASFCLWKLEKRSGKPTKVPYNPRTGQLAKTNDKRRFENALRVHVQCFVFYTGWLSRPLSVILDSEKSGDI